MSAEWKPGDVALRIGAASFGNMIGIRVSGCPWGHGDRDWSETPHWHYENGGWSPADTATPHRPLVVIDPEDRQQVERLGDAFCLARWDHLPGSNECDPLTFSSMQAALREFANPTPPKPPQDVTARVTDRRDNIWRLLADGEWVCVDGPDSGEYIAWDRLASERGPLEVQP